ncbi:hypothetical protein BK133_00820 [Paenibacillus sp. FSL H8-0548]|uniref:portal protein n=1 Tax=Paenibacillus sp. FSL H8-0548 TaxID=1920422 RepID=UPI00096CB0E0|nr:hypothetical protein [Paenibacillus sp. FSL H8-0548]OMF38779.1 hypothetical protein BK133_00820 [Paenibacillus sp. FSL H8-0548]
MSKDKRVGDITTEWLQYQAGIDYNHRVNLYETVNRNEAFYAGEQWQGVVANGLPTPVFNIFKRVINYFIAAIMSQNTKLQFVPENVGEEPANEDEQSIKDAAELISAYSETLWEKNKMNQKLRQWLLDAAISGDACAYIWWNALIDTAQPTKGDIEVDSVDNVNVMFGDPNNSKVKGQPYIIIVARELVESLKEQAKANKIPQEKIDLISSDEDTSYQSGNRSKIELDRKGENSGKTTSLLKLWKKDDKVYAKKITKYTTIREEWETKLSDYPNAHMNWDARKNSYRGQALGTGLIPNQVFVNKMFAMAMMSLMHTAFPKAIYNKSMVSGWNNQIGAAIGIEAVGPETNIGNVAQYLKPGDMSSQVFQLIELTIQQTKEMLGANDALLGNVKPESASGRSIIAVQQASSIPLENIKQNLYQFIEDIGYVWLDFMANYYGTRSIDVEIMGKREIREFDFSKLKDMKFRLKIDVGPSSYWSELTAMETLDALLESERITFEQYLNRVPAGMIPQKQELIQDIKNQDMKQQFIYEQMARFMEQLPPDQQAQLQSLPPEEQESQLMEMMMQPPEQMAQQQASQQDQQQQMMMQQQEQANMAQQQEQMKTQQQFEQQAALKKMDIEGKLALASVQQRNKE